MKDVGTDVIYICNTQGSKSKFISKQIHSQRRFSPDPLPEGGWAL